MIKFVRRDKLVDMLVYDRKGRFVGTVMDIGFIPGENAVGLVVATKDKKEIEIHWSEVASIEDIVLLGKDMIVSSESIETKIGQEEKKEFISSPKQEQKEVTEIPLTPIQSPLQKQELVKKNRMKICPKCGTENDPKYKYCHKCGTKIAT